MLEIQTWMRGYTAAVRSAFGDRVRYIGLQGSRARGEAGPDSDIDVVCILDECSLADLETYQAAVEHLPERDKLCGFVSGAAELAAWDRGDLFSFRHDTEDWYGQLADLLPPEEPGDARRALHTGACGLYHLCCHNFLQLSLQGFDVFLRPLQICGRPGFGVLQLLGVSRRPGLRFLQTSLNICHICVVGSALFLQLFSHGLFQVFSLFSSLIPLLDGLRQFSF